MSRIITMAELQSRSPAQLHALHCKVQQELTESALGSHARRNALASLENISRAMAYARRLQGPRL